MSSRPLVLHVVDRTTGGVPLAVRDYIAHTADVEHAILSPYLRGQPHPVWDGVAAGHRDLGDGAARRISAVRTATRALRPDAVHAHSSFSGIYARVACSSSRQHIVYSPHCFKFDDPGAGRVLRATAQFVERLLARRTSAFAVLSAHEERLARSLSRSARTVLVPNTPTVPLRPRTTPRSHRPFRVGMIGRISPQKDPDFFRSISRSNVVDVDRIDWVWIGGGEAAVQAVLRSDAIEVTGWLASDQLTAALDGLDLYVHSAAYEGFPLSVLDAAARRIPIIARRIAAFEETPLVLFDTPDEAADLISRVAREESFRAALIEKGDTLLETMDAQRQRERLYEVWGQAGRRRHP